MYFILMVNILWASIADDKAGTIIVENKKKRMIILWLYPLHHLYVFLCRYTDLSELNTRVRQSHLAEKLLQYKACLRYYTVEPYHP